MDYEEQLKRCSEEQLTDVNFLTRFMVGGPGIKAAKLAKQTNSFFEACEAGPTPLAQNPLEFARWLIYLYQYRFSITKYLEVGVARGGSLLMADAYLRAVCPNYIGTTGIDIRLKFQGEGFVNKKGNCLIKADSHAYEFEEEYDVAFIDSGHRLSGIRKEWAKLKSIANIIGIHDIFLRHRDSQISTFWNELKKEGYPCKEIHEIKSCFRHLGIGIVPLWEKRESNGDRET